MQTVCVVFKGLNVSIECYLKPHKMDCNYFNLFSVADKVSKNWWKQYDENIGKKINIYLTNL